MADSTDENQSQFVEDADENKGIIDRDWVGGVYGLYIFHVYDIIWTNVCGCIAYCSALLT